MQYKELKIIKMTKIHHNKYFIYRYNNINYKCIIKDLGFTYATILIYIQKEFNLFGFKIQYNSFIIDLRKHDIISPFKKSYTYDNEYIRRFLDNEFINIPKYTKKIN